MKASIILAALLIAAPTASFAGHKGRCVPQPVICHPGFGPRAYYAPQPFFSFSYVSSRPVAYPYVSARPVYRSSRYYDPAGSSVEADVQRALRQRGYYRGSIDGDIGPQSRAAIRDFQADSGLAITGRIDSALLRTLGV